MLFSNSGGRNLIYSPDDDVYHTHHIGLLLLEKNMKSYFVALDSQFKSVLGMKKFSLSLKYDDKLGNTVSEMLPTIQYCMYLRDTIVFFFEDHREKVIFDTFCKNADFIFSR